jgi:hypothetical protein
MPTPRHDDDRTRAKAAVAKRPSPVGQPHEVTMAVKVVLHRGAAEQLTLRAIREGKNIALVLQEMIEAGLRAVAPARERGSASRPHWRERAP